MKILITGAAKRVGRMLSEHLATKGHKIAIHFNSSSSEAKALLKDLGGPEKGHTTIQANLSNLAEATSLLKNLHSSWGKIDLVINNASTYARRGMANFSNDELIDDYTVNFFSPLIIMREFRNIYSEGQIINFIDRRVNFTEAEAGPYGLAKKSLRDATLACAEEWAPSIKVNAIAPGPILLPGESYKNAQHSDLLERVLNTVDHTLESDQSGSVIVIE